MRLLLLRLLLPQLVRRIRSKLRRANRRTTSHKFLALSRHKKDMVKFSIDTSTFLILTPVDWQQLNY